MKKIIILAALFVGVSHYTNAQLKTNPSTATQKVDNRTDEQKIADYKYHIKALDEKEEWIRNNPEELKIAKEQGWFEFAAKTRKELRAQIAELENKKK